MPAKEFFFLIFVLQCIVSLYRIEKIKKNYDVYRLKFLLSFIRHNLRSFCRKFSKLCDQYSSLHWGYVMWLFVYTSRSKNPIRLSLFPTIFPVGIISSFAPVAVVLFFLKSFCAVENQPKHDMNLHDTLSRGHKWFLDEIYNKSLILYFQNGRFRCSFVL